MKEKNIKPLVILAIGILVGALSCFVFGCLWSGGAILLSENSEKLPLRSLHVVIDMEQRSDLFTQLRRFAEKHDFEILIRDVKVYPEGVYIEMTRDDLRIIAHDSANAPENITFGFYDRLPILLAQETVDDLVNDLKTFLEEIPNVTVEERK
jgi:hypothetical protein